MTPADLRALIAAATKGPWATNGTRVECRDDHGWVNDGWIIGDLDGPDAEANTRLIVAAVNALPGLLDRLAAVEKQRDEWREIVLWLLWGHQGFNSEIGLPLRALLRYGRSAHLSVDDLNAAKRGKAQIDAAIAARKGEV